MKKCYLIEVGVLLEPDNEAFCSYSNVYDKRYGYYDEEQYYVTDIDAAINEVTQYVQEGCDHTYGIVMRTILPDDIDVSKAIVQNEEYNIESIVHCLAKIEGKIITDFIKNKED